MKIAVGLVVKGGKEFIDKWLECASKIGDWIFVVDNGADNYTRNKLLNHNAVKRYVIQKGLERNQSRDYQQILEMAREEDCQWVWNLDIDEYIPEINRDDFYVFLLNCREESVGAFLFEMRNDRNHYVMINDYTNKPKHARLSHKIYKLLTHFEFDKRDIHGQSIPHNCKAGPTINIFIQHFGHMNKELRDEKRKQYITKGFKDTEENMASWMEEDEKKIEIKKWEDRPK